MTGDWWILALAWAAWPVGWVLFGRGMSFLDFVCRVGDGLLWLAGIGLAALLLYGCMQSLPEGGSGRAPDTLTDSFRDRR